MERRKGLITKRSALVIAIVLVIVTNLITFGTLTGKIPYLAKLVTPQVEVPLQNEVHEFGKLWRVLHYIELSYYDMDKVTTEELVDGAIKGIVDALGDPPSAYFTQEDWEQLMIHTQGDYSGVGITIFAEDGYIVVIAPFEGSPAEAAGIRADDKIIGVDGESIVGEPLDIVGSKIRGPVNTDVVLTVLRRGVEEPFDVTVTRGHIVIPTVSSQVIDGNLGYIRLNSFSDTTTADFRAALNGLRDQGIDGFILDLRHNPGGLLSTAKDVSDILLPQGPIYHKVDRYGNKETEVTNTPGLELPMVVLVNGSSASASEIVAGAIQDAGVGTLVGVTTYGKGSVQSLIPFEDRTGVKVTTHHYLTRGGRSINEVGIEPDVVVELPEIGFDEEPLDFEDWTDARNTQLIRAVEILKEMIVSGS